MLQELTKARDIMAALVAIVPGDAQWKKDLAWFDRPPSAAASRW
jgi:hypothetical protein